MDKIFVLISQPIFFIIAILILAIIIVTIIFGNKVKTTLKVWGIEFSINVKKSENDSKKTSLEEKKNGNHQTGVSVTNSKIKGNISRVSGGNYYEKSDKK